MQRSKRKKADGMKFDLAKPGEEEAIFRLYRRCVASPYCTWSEEYPAWENIQADMALRSLYVARDAQGSLLAAASLGALNDIDPAGFPALRHPCELARLCVSPAAQGQGVGSRFLHFFAGGSGAARFRRRSPDGERGTENRPAAVPAGRFCRMGKTILLRWLVLSLSIGVAIRKGNLYGTHGRNNGARNSCADHSAGR